MPYVVRQRPPLAGDRLEVELALRLARAVKQHDGRVGTPLAQLALPVDEQRRRQHEQRAIDHARLVRGAEKCGDLHRLAHAHVVAQNAAMLPQMQLPQPRNAGTLMIKQLIELIIIEN
jgi:hypothetical protein